MYRSINGGYQTVRISNEKTSDLPTGPPSRSTRSIVHTSATVLIASQTECATAGRIRVNGSKQRRKNGVWSANWISRVLIPSIRPTGVRLTYIGILAVANCEGSAIINAEIPVVGAPLYVPEEKDDVEKCHHAEAR